MNDFISIIPGADLPSYWGRLYGDAPLASSCVAAMEAPAIALYIKLTGKFEMAEVGSPTQDAVGSALACLVQSVGKPERVFPPGKGMTSWEPATAKKYEKALEGVMDDLGYTFDLQIGAKPEWLAPGAKSYVC